MFCSCENDIKEPDETVSCVPVFDRAISVMHASNDGSSGAAQYCDLAQDAQLALTVWQIQEGQPQTPLGGATLRLFSKKGRLKSGQQELRLWAGREADMAWPSATPAKLPVAQRGEQG